MKGEKGILQSTYKLSFMSLSLCFYFHADYGSLKLLEFGSVNTLMAFFFLKKRNTQHKQTSFSINKQIIWVHQYTIYVLQIEKYKTGSTHSSPAVVNYWFSFEEKCNTRVLSTVVLYMKSAVHFLTAKCYPILIANNMSDFFTHIKTWW